MQGYCTLDSTPEPFVVTAGASTLSAVQTNAVVVVRWSDGTQELPWDVGTVALSVYGGHTIDTSDLVWIVLAVLGQGQPYVAKEADIDTYDSLTGGTWAPLARVEGNRAYRIPQI